MVDLLQIGALLFGTICVLVSCSLAIFFSLNKTKKLARSMAYMLSAEMMMGLATITFTTWDVLFDIPIPPEIAVSLRFVIFGAAAASSIHLSWTIAEVIWGNQDDDKD